MPRSRSARAHRQVLEAALKLFARQGIDATSMDAIAAASGVSKATIYKHWHDKDALCLEALASLFRLDAATAVKTGDNRADMIAVLNRRPRAQRSEPTKSNHAAPHGLCGAQSRFCQGVASPRRCSRRESKSSSCSSAPSPKALFLVLSIWMSRWPCSIGPMMYRHVLAIFGRHLPENLAELVVDAFWRAHFNPPLPNRVAQRGRAATHE